MADSRRRRPVAAVLISLLLLGGALLLIGVAIKQFSPALGKVLPGTGQTKVTHGVVVEQVRSVAQLVTSETTVRDVVVYENRRLGSTKRSLIVVTGKVMAGIDLDAGTQVDLDHSERRVRILLPEAERAHWERLADVAVAQRVHAAPRARARSGGPTASPSTAR